MKHTKITPQIAALYLGALCEVVKAETYWFEKPTVGDKMLVNGKVISMLTTEKGFEIILHLRKAKNATNEQMLAIESAKGNDFLLLSLAAEIDIFGFIEAGLSKEIAP